MHDLVCLENRVLLTLCNLYLIFEQYLIFQSSEMNQRTHNQLLKVL